MRFDKFTTKFQQAFADAQSLAVGNDNPYIEPQHLLLRAAQPGRRRHGVAALARRRQRRRPEERAVRRRSTACRKSKAHGGEVNVSRDLANLLNLTDKEAQKRGDQFIASELFLLALTQDKGETGRLLKQARRDARGVWSRRSTPCAAAKACRARKPKARAKR